MSNSEATESNDVIVEKRGTAGVLILNRPAALNAITLGMVRILHRALTDFATDSDIDRVVITGAGNRAFCAGGDVRRLYEFGRAGRPEEAVLFWREEYLLNTLIKRYPKPYISLIDGFVMGGGVGLSAHGTYQVATEKYAFAMPEATIGFFPDVGAGYILPRLPSCVGRYLAMTGERINAADAQGLGLLSHRIESSNMQSLLEALCSKASIKETLQRFEANNTNGEARVMAQLPVIEHCFSGNSALEILYNLDKADDAGSEFAAKTAQTIRSKSPMSVCIALEQIKRGASMTFEEVMAQDLVMASHFIRGHDFYEGVRAQLVDKDGKPQWKPSRIEDVSKGDVDAYFISDAFSQKG